MEIRIVRRLRGRGQLWIQPLIGHHELLISLWPHGGGGGGGGGDITTVIIPDLSADVEIVQEPGDKADDQQEAMDQVRQIGPGPYEASVVRRYEQAWKMALSSHCGA